MSKAATVTGTKRSRAMAVTHLEHIAKAQHPGAPGKLRRAAVRDLVRRYRRERLT